jgi:hypothetical protein
MCFQVFPPGAIKEVEIIHSSGMINRIQINTRISQAKNFPGVMWGILKAGFPKTRT